MNGSTSKALLAAFLLTLPSLGWTLGLGESTSASRLGEHLEATIKVVSDGEFYHAHEIKARKVSIEKAKKLGFDVDYTPHQFDFTSEGKGESLIIKLKSRKKIQEPFLNIVVELEWPGGIIYREYTFLLNPA